jgi:glycosyltransferase involved in cell wall biosynthesis
MFWNRIEESLPPGTAAYYEHGAAWNVPVSKKRLEFLSHCSHYIANSQAAAIILKEKWQVSSPITVVPNPLRPDVIITDTPKALSPSVPLRLGFIGRLVPVKGLFVALHTLKALRDRGVSATLTIAGVGPLEAIARQHSSALGISSSVTWKGCLDSVTDFYDSIDLLLVPSLREPLGLVSLEAAARGVPVIAAAVDGLPEAVLHGTTGICVSPTLMLSEAKDLVMFLDAIPDVIVNPVTKTLEPPKVSDPAHMADAIEFLLNNQDVYRLYSTNGMCHARSRADFPSYFDALSVVLEQPKSLLPEGERDSSLASQHAP